MKCKEYFKKNSEARIQDSEGSQEPGRIQNSEEDVLS
jgi:hypothetical protein